MRRIKRALTLFRRRETAPQSTLKRTCGRSSVGGLRRLGRPREHAPTVPPREPVTGPSYRCRSVVLSVLFCIKEKAPGCTHSMVCRTCFHMLQQALMPGHSVEEPAHRRPLCAQVMCSHASFISEPTVWPATPLLHLHRADATVEHCAAVMGLQVGDAARTPVPDALPGRAR